MPEDGSEGIDTSSPEFKQAAEEWLKEQGIHSALQEERDARKQLEKKLDKLSDVDPEEYRELKSAAEKAEEERAREAGKFDELMEKERKKWENIVSDKDAKIESLQSSLEDTLIESAAKTAISTHGGDAELLLPHVTKNTKLMEVDGRHVAVVVDSKGEPRLAPDAKTASDYMGIESLVADWKEGGKYPGAFAGTGMSGGGAGGSGSGAGAGGGAPKRISPDDHASLQKYEKEIASGEVVVDFAG